MTLGKGSPHRPATEADLGFSRCRSVRWFSPRVLARAGLRVVLSDAFGVFLDKRELQTAIEVEPLDHHAGSSELWIDYIADSGDGFPATYTIAWLIAQRQLWVRGVGKALPRASVLVMGGDEVYPLADADEYENRLVGPYQAALPWVREPNNPHLLSLPGNHDWYDGLTSFMRVFCQQKWIGGWKTCQRRSYFAMQLPWRWWMWGIDIQLDSYIDDAQLRYFKTQAKLLRPGDRIILCTAKPSWVDSDEEYSAYRNLAYLERTFIRPAGAQLMLTLSGDSHHYGHYVGQDGSHKICCGGGGAFLHPTHDLPEKLYLPPKELSAEANPKYEARQCYNRVRCFPTSATSRLLALGAVGLPFVNPSFMLIPAVFHVLLFWAAQFGIRALELGSDASLAQAAVTFGFRDLVVGLFRSPFALILILIFAGVLVGFAKPRKRWQHRLFAKTVMGLIHAMAQLAAAPVVALLSIRLASSLADGGWFVFWLFAFVALFGGIVGGVVMGVYLAICTLFPGLNAHGNEAFSSMRRTRYKNFLRLHIDNNGVLRVYPIGLQRVLQNRDWKLDADPGSTDGLDPRDEPPWFSPKKDPPEPELIEEPIVIDRLLRPSPPNGQG
jgi:hypothetical protein